MWESIKKNIGVIVSFFFAMLSLLYSINSDIIAQNNAFFLWVPYESLKMKCEEKPLENITKEVEEKKHQLTYIFVLDISRSLQYSGATPRWYNQEAINQLNHYVSNSELEFKFDNNPEAFELSRVRLAQLLVELYKKDNVKFEIWELGDTASDKYSSVRESYNERIEKIRKPLTYLIDVAGDRDLNTDFSSLFIRLCRKHQELLNKSKLNKYKMPSFVLVILSDLIHDIGPQILSNPSLPNKNVKQRFFENSTETLMKKITEVTEANLIANMILMAGNYDGRITGRTEYKLHLWKTLKKNFVPSRVETYLISERPADILYANIFTEPSINFYYRNPIHVGSSSTIIRINKSGEYRVGLTWERNRSQNQILTMEYVILAPNDQPLKDKDGQFVQGILSTNGALKDTTPLVSDCKIKLSYSGPPPSNESFPYLKVFYPQLEKEAFTIPINFVKILPVEIAYLMLVLEILLGLAILLFIWLRVVMPKIDFSRKYRAIINA